MSNSNPDVLLPGIYRRAVTMVVHAGEVRADMEDDFHRVGVTLDHDTTHITRASGRTYRIPFTTCPGALAKLPALVGLTVRASAMAARRYTDSHQQCTHLFDLACLALAYAGRPGGVRYDIAVQATVSQTRIASISVNGQPHWRWMITQGHITAPAPFVGRPLDALPIWSKTHLSSQDREAAFVLRRGLWISRGRWTSAEKPAATGFLQLQPTCHTLQPAVSPEAVYQSDSVRDFTFHPEYLLADLVEG